MNTNNIFTNYGWVGLGSLAGLCLGSISNFSQTGSIFKRPKRPEGFDGGEHRRQNPINSFRERIVYAGLTPGFLTLVPVTACVTWNILAGGASNITGRIASETYSHILYPLIPMVSSLYIGGRGLRGLWEAKVPKSERIDISGHALMQMGSLIQTVYTLKSFADHDHPIQHAALGALAGAVSATDAVFMYNTTAYTHSIVDVVAGIALPILGYLGFQMAESFCQSLY